MPNNDEPALAVIKPPIVKELANLTASVTPKVPFTCNVYSGVVVRMPT
jgi:hypothetical protein